MCTRIFVSAGARRSFEFEMRWWPRGPSNHNSASKSDFDLGWRDETTAVLVRLVGQHLARDIGPSQCMAGSPKISTTANYRCPKHPRIHASTHPRIPFHACLVERQRLVTLVIPDWPLQPETPCAAGISLGGLDPPERSRRMPRLVLSLPSSSLDLARAASSSVLSLAAIADALTAHEQTAPEDKPC